MITQRIDTSPDPKRHDHQKRSRVRASRASLRTVLVVATVAALALTLVPDASAQLANTGYSTRYGKNKVTYEAFDFWTYQAPHFDVYYYPEEEAHLDEVVAYAEYAYRILSAKMNHQLSKRTPIIFYQTHAEFEQTHILPFFLPEGVAAFAEPAANRLVLPVDDPPDKLQKLILHEITHIFEFDFFFGSRLGRAMRAQPPGWVMEGFAEHVADNLTTLDEMLLRDIVISDEIPTLVQMTYNRGFFIDYVLGEVVWDYIEQEYGIEGIRIFLSEIRRDLGQDIERDLERAFNISPQEFNDNFRQFLRDRYLPNVLEREEAQDFAQLVFADTPAAQRPAIFTPVLSPDGSEFAAIGVNLRSLTLDIFRYDLESGQELRNLTGGMHGDYEYIIGQGVTVGFEAGNDISWSADGRTVAFFARTGPTRTLFILDAQSGNVVHEKKLELDQALSPNIGPDGRIAFGAHLNGVRDIWIYDPRDESVSNVTQDELHDYAPVWSPDGRSLVFASHVLGAKKLFRIDLSRPQQRVQLTFGLADDTQPSFSADGSELFFSSDRDGQFNLYGLELASDTVRRYTNLLLGGFFPHPIPGTDKLLFSSFGEREYDLFTADRLEPFEVFAAVDEDLEEEEIDRIEAEMAATATVELSEDNVTRSASGGWHIEDIQIAGGVTSRGTILSNTAIIASDLLGNHRIAAILGSVESQRNYSVAYTNMRTRLNWGIYGTSQRSYFLFVDPIQGDIDRQSVYALDGGEIYAEYPISRDMRIELSAGYFRREYNLGGFLQSTGGQTSALSDHYTDGTYVPLGFSIITDRSRFKEYGAFAGRRYSLNTSIAPPSIGDLSFYDVSVDWREYLQVTRESQLALRLWGSMSYGDDPSLFFFGGLNQLRGYNFLEFSGNRAFFANLEFRFPLIYEAALGSLAIRHIRGTIFLDVGAGWFNDEEFTFWEDGRLVDARGSFGIGIGFFLGPMPLNWYLSQRTDFKELFGDPTISFYLGPTF